MSLPGAIKHIVVLMLENRSLDHMLGHLPGVDGPAGRSNVDPKDNTVVPVTFDANAFSPALEDDDEYVGDPLHDVPSVNRQLYETPTPTAHTPVTCGGFIRAGRESGEEQADRIAREVMRCFDTEKLLPTMTALANEFVVCDQWFSSVPGPTWPNRLFAHAATSFGRATNKLTFYKNRTIFKQLDQAKVDWAVYYHDIPQSACFIGLARARDSRRRKCMRPMKHFYEDAAGNTLPSYVFIEPGYFEGGRGLWGRSLEALKWFFGKLGLPVRQSLDQANDQHAPHDVRLGEHLIADVYDALRANEEIWKGTLLLVLHDEHGGLFDHFKPPSASSPDGKISKKPPFDFTRAGLRVPALLISPWVDNGVDSTPYEHSSIVRTVREQFCSDQSYLTERDKEANPIGRRFRETPRPTPMTIVRPTPTFLIPAHGDPERRPTNDLQDSLVQLAEAIAPGGAADRLAVEMATVDFREQPDAVDVTDERPLKMPEAEARRRVRRVMTAIDERP
jgi:phospholipase C